MRCLLPLLLLVAIPVGQAQTTHAGSSALDTLSRCAASAQTPAAEDADAELESSNPEGLEALETRCPGLQAALHELGYDELITAASRDALTIGKLAELQRLAERYSDPAPDVIDTAPLDDVLERIQPYEVERTPTLWQQATAWLRDLFGRKAKKESRRGSLTDEIEVSDTVRKILYWSVVALVIGLATAVVMNELRAAGLLRAETPSARSARNDALASGATEVVSMDDLERAPLHERPSVLLRVLIATLTRTGRLATAKALTHRELTSRATFEESRQRESFQRVSGFAERALYGGDTLAPEQVERIVEEGRSLDASLRGSAT